ncbi:MAG: ABC transporter permease [Nocardioidaceae bacterium]
MSTLTSTGTIALFFLRRDRIALLCWVVGGFLLYATQGPSIESTYPTQAELDRAAASMGGNPAFIAMLGPDRALNTIGGQVAWQVSAMGPILAGLMSMFLVGRHTRAEEETGREELVRSGVVGRYASFSAAAIVTTIANAVLAAVVTIGLIASDLPAAGSLALGLGLFASGLVFMGVALLAAQLSESTRGMYGITGAVIGIAYVIRGVGDVGNGAFSWLSPIGWAQAMRAYADEVWWPVLLSIAAAAVLVMIALRLLRHRDVGAGILPPRPGPARAPAGMRSELGLAWRLQRGTFIGWAIGLFAIGASYGSIGTDVEDIMGTGTAADMMAQGGGALTDSFYATTALMMALFGSAYAIQAALRLRGEESAGRIESLLATSLSRSRWLWSHALIVLLGSLVVVGLGGFGTGLMYGIMSDDLGQIPRLLGASLVHVPSTLVLAGVAITLVGVLPRFATAAWAALAFCVVVLIFGTVLDLPGWLVNLSPFQHSPMVPVADFDPTTVATIAVVAAGLFAAGTLGLRRRDIQTL